MATIGETWKHRMAERLSALTDGKIHVRYEPTTHYASDCESESPQSKGHLYQGRVGAECYDDIVCLDDRKPESLRVQLAAELRAIAAYYVTLADKVEGSQLPR
jgi:hypothetical protein